VSCHSDSTRTEVDVPHPRVEGRAVGSQKSRSYHYCADFDLRALFFDFGT